jgi:hypothetical protein
VIPLTPANNRYFVFQRHAELISVIPVQCAPRFTCRGGDDDDGSAIMHIRAWQGGLRDFRADWHLWSRSERIAAGLLAVSIAALAVLFPS